MDVIGGGLLVAVAAALWIAYLLPNWLRRRQYLATERNAVRLQQTLRILAETAETPEAVRVEATARDVVAQQRILQQREATARLTAEAEEREALAERWAAEGAVDAARLRVGVVLAAAAAATEPIAIIPPVESSTATGAVPAVRTAVNAVARKRLRRGRALCSLVLLISLLTVIGGAVAASFGASLIAPAIGALGMALAFAGLVRLARVRPVVPVAVQPAPVVEAAPFEPIDLAEPESQADGWVPQPLPKPLHLSRGTIAAMAMASIDAAAELKRAEVGDDIARRAAELEPELPAIAPAAAAATAATSARASAPVRAEAAASPYARMGIIDEAQPGFGDLDAVLRRRRQAG